MPYTIGAVDAALRLLETLAEHPDAGITQLATLMGGTKSHVFRLLRTLEARGYVVRDERTGGYTLGYRMVLLGELAKSQTNLLTVAKPVMDELTSAVAENTHLVVREGTQSLTLAVSYGLHQVGLYARPGRLGPLHAGGSSKVLLAHAPPEVIDEVIHGPLEKFTDATITDPAQLRRLLTDIKNSGYHFSEDDLDVGAFSVAAPIWGPTGNVIAALSIAGPVFRLTPMIRETHTRAVREAAERLSVQLGARRRISVMP